MSEPPLPSASGKRQGGTPLISAVPLNAISDLLYARDEVNRRDWLIDGGAYVSLIPPSTAQRTAGPVGTRLQAANGTEIHCFGTAQLTVTLGTRAYTYDFIIADLLGKNNQTPFGF